MPENFLGGFEDEKQVTEESVEKFYHFKTMLRTAKNESSIVDLCKDAGIRIAEDKKVTNNNSFRKEILEMYLVLHFPQSSSGGEQMEKRERNVHTISEYLHENRSHSIMWVGGSYATGKLGTSHSDLDLFFGLPKLPPNDAERELNIFKNMRSIGFVMASNTAPFEDLLPAFQTGKGLVRLSGMTSDGVEIDFHGIGIDDLYKMNKAMPGFIERVRKVESYSEDRTSFRGDKRILSKPGDFLFNYKESDGEMFKGFYPDNFSALGELTYDPDEKGKEIQNLLWRGIVKGFVFHNEGYQKDSQGMTIGIDRKKLAFNDFLKTLYYQFPKDYGEKKLRMIEAKYNEVLDQLSQEYNEHSLFVLAGRSTRLMPYAFSDNVF